MAPETVPKAALQAGRLAVRVYESREEMGRAAAQHAADRLRALAAEHEIVPVIFATGASQLATLEALTAIPGLPWDRVIGFHMDEYLGIPENHPASFRRYLQEHLTGRVPMREFYGINGTDGNVERVMRAYADLLHAYPPRLCLLGIGENGHLAFNDPAEADFNDPYEIKVVTLDEVCREQQRSEGWFATLDEVPRRAITLSIPTLFRVPELILSVPGARKAQIVRQTLYGPISPACPATVLRRHPNATVYLDRESAAQLNL
jgi:glucosamine-6-phosphate deaminase